MARTTTPAAPSGPIDIDMQIQRIAIADIFPSPTNPRKHIDEKKLAELADSIKKHGVIQPVTLRPKLGMVAKFELVCGERRYLASKLAGFPDIRAIVRELADDEVLDMQFAEKLDRVDVHAMDEAVTFKAMLDTGRYTIADIAALVVKSETFVAQRLSLNNLIPELQKDFWEDKFLIGHAILFSRLPAKDQKDLHKQYGGRDNYDTLSNTKDWIDRNVIRKLSSAPFKRDDAELFPAAGPCTTCPKRSGCNTSLFADYSDDDRCFDQACFQKKLNAFTIQKVKTTIETKPEILLVESGSYGDKVSPEVKKLANDMKVEIIEPSYNTISSYKSGNATPVKVLMVSGSDVGKIKTMYAQSKKIKAAAGVASAAAGKPIKRTEGDVQADIDALNARQERALELDSEKVWEKVNDILDDPSDFPMDELSSPAFSDDERNAMAIALIGKMDDPDYEDKAFQILKIKGIDGEWDIEVKDLSRFKVTYEQLRALQRLFMISVMRKGSGYRTDVNPHLLMKVLKETPSFKKQIQGLEDAQATEAEKRIANAKKRMDALVKEKKELQGAKSKKSAPSEKASPDKKKSAAKKTNAKADGSKRLVDMTDDELDAFNDVPFNTPADGFGSGYEEDDE